MPKRETGETSSEIEASSETTEPLTPDELDRAVVMYSQQHLDYLKSRGIDMSAAQRDHEPGRAKEVQDYMDSYNETSRKGAELNPLWARSDLKKYEEEKAKKQKSAQK